MDPCRSGRRRSHVSTEEQRPREARLHALLRRQDGVISLDQARELGISDQAVRRWVAAGRWYRIEVFLANLRRVLASRS